MSRYFYSFFTQFVSFHNQHLSDSEEKFETFAERIKTMERTTHKDLKKVIEDNSDIPGRVGKLETSMKTTLDQIGEVHDGIDFTMASFEELNKTFTQSAERTTKR